jgi:ABC-type transport system involved in multi-copper enzyme maturation permease subunit
MTVLPVIARELRSAARHSFTYYLRAIGVGSLLLASFLFGLEHGFGATMGGKLFGSLHATLFFAIWILVPLLTADCISRERREGTLGLLFMTPLKGTDVVVAKSAAHGLRAMTLWVAVLPVLTVPFLLGGVSWHEAMLSVLVNFSAMCWALAAGLLASAWSKVWLRALFRAAALAIAFLILLGFSFGCWVLLPAMSSGRRAWFAGSNAMAQFQTSSDYVLAAGMGFVSNISGNWPSYLRMASVNQLFSAMAQVTAFSVVVLALAILASGAKTRRSWQDESRSTRQIWLEKTFCTPFLWLSFFRGWMRRKLERNPIGWLEQRTWTGRLVIWGWLAVIISVYSAMLTDRNFFRHSSSLQGLIAVLLAGSMASSAAGSFRRERETGVLELLLVSPIGENDIVTGRLRGLWGQFLPAFGLLLGVWAYLSSFTPGSLDGEAIFFYAITYLTIPVVGLYFSLRCRNFITAFLSSLGAGLLMPLILPLLWRVSDPTSAVGIGSSGPAAFVQLILAGFCWSRLVDRLKKRNFPLDKTD